MKSDMLALGFITSKEDAVLFRVDSGTSNDYMELEIVSAQLISPSTHTLYMNSNNQGGGQRVYGVQHGHQRPPDR
jgi:hypothetical protein